MTAKTPPHTPFRPALQLVTRDAQRISTLARRTARFTATLGNPGISWQCSMVPSGTLCPPGKNDILVQLEWEGSPLTLQLPGHTLQKWLENQTAGLQLPALPEAIAVAALDAWINQILGTLQNDSASAIRVIGRTTNPDAIQTQPLAWAFSLRSSDASAPIRGTLHSTTAALDKLTTLTEHVPQVPGPVDISTLGIDTHALIGRTAISVSMCSALRRGDVILLDQCLISTDGQFWLTPGASSGVRIRPEHGRYTVTQGWTSLMTESETNDRHPDTAPENVTQAGTDEQHDDAGFPDTGADTDTDQDTEERAREAPGSLDDITIQLSFDLGHRRFSLAELQALQPGEVFDLARPLNDGPVHIRANGTLIGYGELVDIEGRIGVQVSRLGPSQ